MLNCVEFCVCCVMMWVSCWCYVGVGWCCVEVCCVDLNCIVCCVVLSCVGAGVYVGVVSCCVVLWWIVLVL